MESILSSTEAAMRPLQKKTYDRVPREVPARTILSFPPRNENDAFYAERTDRHFPWISREEQQTRCREAVVCIAGTGGMGGLIAQAFVRQGIGTIRIADPEVFDASNINRQFAALRSTIGRSKALETARLLRAITDDYHLDVYPQGIEVEMLPSFLEGAHLIMDEIEFWNIGACILLHQMARTLGIPILNCLTVGFATYVHYFTPTSMTVEQMLDIDLEEGLAWDAAAKAGVSPEERGRMMRKILRCFIPDFPEYFSGGMDNPHNAAPLDRLEQEGKAAILATNPLVAAGVAADRALLYLLSDNGRSHAPNVTELPSTPGYVRLDIASLPAGTACLRDTVV